MTNPTSSSRDAPDSGSSEANKAKTEAMARAKALVQTQAKEGARAVESRARSVASVGMAQAEEQLRGLSRALESTRSELEQENHPLAGAFGSAHDRVDDVARGLADRDPRQLVGDAERLARRSPWLFIGGCFVGGVALARFLKASEPDPQIEADPQIMRREPDWMPETAPRPARALPVETHSLQNETHALQNAMYDARGEGRE